MKVPLLDVVVAIPERSSNLFKPTFDSDDYLLFRRQICVNRILSCHWVDIMFYVLPDLQIILTKIQWNPVLRSSLPFELKSRKFCLLLLRRRSTLEKDQ